MKSLANLYIISILLLMASCSDSFLNLSPESKQTEQTFYLTEDHFEQATNGVYQGLRNIEARTGFIMGEMRSDNTHYVRNEIDRGQRRAEEIADFTSDAVNTLTEDYYKYCFSAIARANTVIDRIGDRGFTESFNNKIIGQTKFLRAYYYFKLVQYYGPVSLHLEEVKNPDKAFLPRSSVEEVYTAITNDLKDAISRLEDPVFPQSGRITKGTAKMFYAQVLMTMPTRNYALAEQELRDIMKMGYSLIDYADLFDAKHKNSSESIFELQYKQGDTGQHSTYIYWMMPITNDGVVITGVPGSNNTSNGGFGIPTQELIDSYEAGDRRLNASVSVAVGLTNAQSGIMEIEKVLPVADPAIKEYPSYCYFVKKYNNPHEKVDNTDDNFPIYRYSEVYLLLAECLVEQGRASEALPYVNEVRKRAGLANVAAVTAKVVADERRHEFAFESKRWPDLVRTGQAITVMNEYGKKMKALYPYIESRAYQVNSDKLIFPIPFRQLQINSQLVQNPGYN